MESNELVLASFGVMLILAQVILVVVQRKNHKKNPGENLGGDIKEALESAVKSITARDAEHWEEVRKSLQTAIRTSAAKDAEQWEDFKSLLSRKFDGFIESLDRMSDRQKTHHQSQMECLRAMKSELAAANATLEVLKARRCLATE